MFSKEFMTEFEIKPNPKCNACKCYFTPILNIKSGTFYKSCEKCKLRQKNYRNNNKCQHNRERHKCKDCGGASICEHNKVRSKCKDCGGSQICEHNRVRSKCKDCCPLLCIVSLQRNNIRRIMMQTDIIKTKPSIEYLGCSVEYFKEYIESKMTFEMNFENIHYDHIKPVSKFDLHDEEELFKCCHYTNFQPLLATDNLIKNNKWSDENELFWNKNICGKEYIELYIPN